MTSIFDRKISKNYTQADIENWFKRMARNKEFEVFEAWLASEKDELVRRISKVKKQGDDIDNLRGRLYIIAETEAKLLSYKE